MPYCGCEDWPCCGHVDSSERHLVAPDLRQYCDGPEDADSWYDSLDGEEQAFVEEHLQQCVSCGEWTSPANLEEGVCVMCKDQPSRSRSATAGANVGRMVGRLEQRIADLELELEEARAAA